jgi:MGT family glycosyltransferase
MITMAHMFVKLAKESIDKFLVEWKNEDFDLIIHDSCAFAGVVLERLLSVKSINSTTTMFYTPEIVKKISLDIAAKDLLRSFFVSPLDWVRYFYQAYQLKKSYNVFPMTLDVMTSVTDMNIVYTSRELQPHSEVLDPHKFKFLGSVIESRPRDENFPYERLDNTRVVYVSLGTVYTTNIEFFKNCFKALRSMKDVTVVVSLGPNIDPAKLGDIPSNFIIRKFIPQLEVLKKAEIFISHAGNNSLNESLSFGVPMVLCPQQGEQTTAARQFEKKGVAVNTASKCPSSDVILSAVNTILADSRYRREAIKASVSLDEARNNESISKVINAYVKA